MKSTEKLIKERIKALEEENKKLKERLYFIVDRNDKKQETMDKAIEKLESIRVFGLRSGKTLFSTLINESIDILQGEDNDNN